MTTVTRPLHTLRRHALSHIQEAINLVHKRDAHYDYYKLLEKSCAKLETLVMNTK